MPMLDRRTLFRNACAALSLAGASAKGAQAQDAIWDVHCHLASVPGATPEERMAGIVRYLDRMGIERVMLSMGFRIIVNPSPEELRESNDQVLRAVRSRPDRAYGFVYLNPNYLEASLAEFNRCVRDGPMVGIKLWVARRCSAPELDPLLERAVALKVPVLQHTWFKVTGNLGGESTPNDVAELARRHPEASIVCGHTGGDWEAGIRAIRSCGNVVAGIAGSNPTSGFVELAVRELGPERVVFGSDAFGRSFASQLGKVFGAEIPPSVKGLILGGNLRRILTPILRAKGYRAA